MKKLALTLVSAYQLFFSSLFGPACRFEPTCSEYAYRAIDSHGLLKGGWLSIKRLLRCHPLHPGGFDPVP